MRCKGTTFSRTTKRLTPFYIKINVISLLFLCTISVRTKRNATFALVVVITINRC